jgi:hypothetical protein
MTLCSRPPIVVRAVPIDAAKLATTVGVTARHNETGRYAIATVTGATHASAAAFVDFLTSP